MGRDRAAPGALRSIGSIGPAISNACIVAHTHGVCAHLLQPREEPALLVGGDEVRGRSAAGTRAALPWAGPRAAAVGAVRAGERDRVAPLGARGAGAVPCVREIDGGKE